ncbi:hypothetical protein VNI00_006147 [Paramarasmius palmivorus]|uniref:Uncharacterized protein n=1 Tax=Paramarasmius palmivorus TaxID=297713 RepID=A0AAW0D870_9AGAR
MSVALAFVRQSLFRLVSGSDSEVSTQSVPHVVPQHKRTPLIEDNESDGSGPSETLIDYPYYLSGDGPVDRPIEDKVYEKVPDSTFVTLEARTLANWLGLWIVDRVNPSSTSRIAIRRDNFAVLTLRISNVLRVVSPSCSAILIALEYLDRMLLLTSLSEIPDDNSCLRVMYYLFLLSLEFTFTIRGERTPITSQQWYPTPTELAGRLRAYYLDGLRNDFDVPSDLVCRFEDHARQILCDLYDCDTLDDFFRNAKAELEAREDTRSVYGTPPSSPEIDLSPEYSAEEMRLYKEREVQEFCVTLDAIMLVPARSAPDREQASDMLIPESDVSEIGTSELATGSPQVQSSATVPVSFRTIPDEQSQVVSSPSRYSTSVENIPAPTVNSVPTESAVDLASPLSATFHHLQRLPSSHQAVNSTNQPATGIDLFLPDPPVGDLGMIQELQAIYDEAELVKITFGSVAMTPVSHARVDICARRLVPRRPRPAHEPVEEKLLGSNGSVVGVITPQHQGDHYARQNEGAVKGDSLWGSDFTAAPTTAAQEDSMDVGEEETIVENTPFLNLGELGALTHRDRRLRLPLFAVPLPLHVPPAPMPQYIPLPAVPDFFPVYDLFSSSVPGISPSVPSGLARLAPGYQRPAQQTVVLSPLADLDILGPEALVSASDEVIPRIPKRLLPVYQPIPRYGHLGIPGHFDRRFSFFRPYFRPRWNPI